MLVSHAGPNTAVTGRSQAVPRMRTGPRGTVRGMTTDVLLPRRRAWRELTRQEKQAALADLRRRQRAQIAAELRELRALRRR